MGKLPNAVCPECKTQNDLGAVLCKKCGEILPKSQRKGSGSEFDATEGTFSPGCLIVPGVIFVLGMLFIFMSFMGGPKEGTCAFNRNKISRAVVRFNRANSGLKMTTLDWEALARPSGKSRKPILSDRPTCPKQPSAQYSLDSEGNAVCSSCGK